MAKKVPRDNGVTRWHFDIGRSRKLSGVALGSGDLRLYKLGSKQMPIDKYQIPKYSDSHNSQTRKLVCFSQYLLQVVLANLIRVFLRGKNHNLNTKGNIYLKDGLPLSKQKQNMSNNKKQFGVWMDTHHATIVGKEDVDNGEFIILGHVENEGADRNSNENAANNQEITLRQKFFKEIAMLMPNVDEIHITGTGQAQEQFMHFLADTAQYKNAVSSESTSNKMSDENLIEYIKDYFN